MLPGCRLRVTLSRPARRSGISADGALLLGEEVLDDVRGVHQVHRDAGLGHLLLDDLADAWVSGVELA